MGLKSPSTAKMTEVLAAQGEFFWGTNRSYFVGNGLDQPYLTNFIPIYYPYILPYVCMHTLYVCILYTLKYKGSRMSDPQGSGHPGSRMG